MQTKLHTLVLFMVVAGLTACQYVSPRPASEGGDAEGGLANERQRTGAGGAPKSSGTAPRRAAEPPAPTPRPRVEVLVPAGTWLPMTLETAASSATSRKGDLVIARLTEDVRGGDRVALREGSEVRGRVTAAVGSGRVKGRARLALAFETLEVHGRRYEFEATVIDITAGSTHKRDAAIVGGGALVGALVKGKKGAGVGALLGGGAVLATKGKEITLPAGTPIKLKLKRALRIE